MLFMLSLYLLIVLVTFGVLLAFVVLEGGVLSPKARHLPAAKPEGQPYLNIAPASDIRRATRAKEAMRLS